MGSVLGLGVCYTPGRGIFHTTAVHQPPTTTPPQREREEKGEEGVKERDRERQGRATGGGGESAREREVLREG